MKRVFSRIYGSEIVHNTNRRFGSVSVYFVAYFHGADGVEPLLFTEKEIEGAKKRAAVNREDVGRPNRSWLLESWYRLIRLLK